MLTGLRRLLGLLRLKTKWFLPRNWRVVTIEQFISSVGEKSCRKNLFDFVNRKFEIMGRVDGHPAHRLSKSTPNLILN